MSEERGKEFESFDRSEEHTSELQSQSNLVCRLLLEKKKEWRPQPVAHDERRCEQEATGLPNGHPHDGAPFRAPRRPLRLRLRTDGSADVRISRRRRSSDRHTSADRTSKLPEGPPPRVAGLPRLRVDAKLRYRVPP